MKVRAKTVSLELNYKEAIEILARLRSHPDKGDFIYDGSNGAGKLHTLLQAQFETETRGVHVL